MKQTVEAAATQHANKMGWDDDPEEIRKLFAYSFKEGAEWQAKQSPWISVEEQVPSTNRIVLVVTEIGEVFIGFYYLDKWFFLRNDTNFKVVAWMEIPSFDEILEANKDVLQRLK